mgnify:CR=1 FL=1
MSTPTQFAGSPWKDCMDIYPPVAKIASALQDPGKKVPGRHKGKPIVKHKFPLIEKLATKMYNGILDVLFADSGWNLSLPTQSMIFVQRQSKDSFDILNILLKCCRVIWPLNLAHVGTCFLRGKDLLSRRCSLKWSDSKDSNNATLSSTCNFSSVNKNNSKTKSCVCVCTTCKGDMVDDGVGTKKKLRWFYAKK